MEYIILVSGLVLVVVGWLCYRFPNMINPYGNMTPERKALVDIDGLKKASFIIMAITGILLIVTALLYIFKVISEIMSVNIMTLLVLLMIVPLFIAMKKYNGFGRDKSGRAAPIITRPAKWVWVGMGLTAVFVIAIFAFSNQTPKIVVSEEKISISGMYGRDIPTAGILSVELLEKLPDIKMRTNGSATGKYLKGHFLLKNGENCMIFVRTEAPYIELRTIDNLYYFNNANAEETNGLYEQIKALKP